MHFTMQFASDIFALHIAMRSGQSWRGGSNLCSGSRLHTLFLALCSCHDSINHSFRWAGVQGQLVEAGSYQPPMLPDWRRPHA